MKFKYTLANGGSQSVKDSQDLDEMLNCLFRTDNEQKWTTRMTPYDRVAMCGILKLYTFGNLRSRKKLKKLLEDDIYAFFDARFPEQNIDSLLSKYLFTFELYLYGPDLGQTLNPMDISDFKPDLLLQRFDDYPDTELFALIMHGDQDEPTHMHGIFYFTDDSYDKNMDIIIDVLSRKGKKED